MNMDHYLIAYQYIQLEVFNVFLIISQLLFVQILSFFHSILSFVIFIEIHKISDYLLDTFHLLFLLFI
ncbi:TPA: hypothetical protein DEG21_04515 [Patescibacteria group bacterium]|nr:hypothetical protein [Candidatus Gracilibacteria bacterium]HBY75099.1 hypothetical protein [Candidatus Gracilibacteria bacterium]